MASATALLASLAAGMLLAFFYFRSLWHTVRNLPDFKHPLRCLSVSYAGRVVIVMTGFYLVMGTHPERLAMAMAGFLLTRHILVRRLGGFAGQG
jgi:F1F0 ATPase subunit 2